MPLKSQKKPLTYHKGILGSGLQTVCLTSLSRVPFPLYLILAPSHPLPQCLQSHRSGTYIVPNVSRGIWLTGTIFFQESIQSTQNLRVAIEHWAFISTSPVSGDSQLFTERHSWTRIPLAPSAHSGFYLYCARWFATNRICTATPLASFNAESWYESASHSARLELSHRVNGTVFHRGHNSY